MMWLVEEPVYIAILGLLTTLICVFGWTQTGYRQFAYGAGGAVAATLVLLLVEQWVETDREELERALHEMAADVEANNLPAVLSHLASSAADARHQAESEFPRYHFTRVSIKHNLKVRIDAQAQPARATATFNVVVEGTETSTGMTFHVPRYVELQLVREGGRWKLITYHHQEPQLGLGAQQQNR